MKFMYSASRLMKAGEVKSLCEEMKENKKLLMQQELIIKNTLFKINEKAAS
ncbi:hypothetical protein [Heyndrickxia oleronia]|uniref:Uncharacterized protein n=1 Tax=Heyndrickxia oleronia TaxID=38875 RepID=A0AAW6STU7_9BACI|nr:hypothetical protein [Heyndrickxia oleronia]MDH5160379.1 hypothetical protein [Heyndrickxia oleronia]